MMSDWTKDDGAYVLPLEPAENSSAERLEVRRVDSDTERNCERYGVDYDPVAKWQLEVKYTSPVDEWVMESLHVTIKEAKAAAEETKRIHESFIRKVKDEDGEVHWRYEQ